MFMWMCMFSAVVWCGFAYGLAPLCVYYLFPILIFASWLVITTFLHHNDDESAWYSNKKWSYVKGNLTSVDRDYGVFNNVIHNIGTHQIHHLFPKIPHYHLVACTKVFRAKYPKLVFVSNESILPTFLRVVKMYAAYGQMVGDWEVFSLAKNREVIESKKTM